ncbi:MAG: hypothetical protein ACK52U_13935 [Synechococcaceae cyanobacterium]|jgi:hypothetical protein
MGAEDQQLERHGAGSPSDRHRPAAERAGPESRHRPNGTTPWATSAIPAAGPQPTGKQHLSAFIWSVADLLRGDDKQSDQGKLILSFSV